MLFNRATLVAVGISAAAVILAATSAALTLRGHVHRSEYLGLARAAVDDLYTMPRGFALGSWAFRDVELRTELAVYLTYARRLRAGLLISNDRNAADSIDRGIQHIFADEPEDMGLPAQAGG